MFCPLVVLAKLSLIAKWLARKTPLRKPNRGKGIVFRKPRLKSVHNFLSLLYCFIVWLCICVVSCPYVIYYPTAMARYSLFVLKVPLNPKQTNKQKYLYVVCGCIATGENYRKLILIWRLFIQHVTTLAVLRSNDESHWAGLWMALDVLSAYVVVISASTCLPEGKGKR